MANLKEVAELSWQHIFPSGRAAIPKESFVRTAFMEFAYQTLLMSWKEKADEGYYEVPSYLLTEVELPVADNKMDISSLKYFKSLPWLQNIGGLNCKCNYIQSSVNMSQLMCGDDSLDDADKTYFILNKSIVFPKGVHKSPLTLIYANAGEGIDGSIEVDEAIASIIRDKLDAIYLGKLPPSDETNNENSNS